jgi:glycosyltransferase involved in cell wall biosynthesis
MVTVVIPCRNAEAWIAETVKSALQEGCVEILLVDDGSTDRSNEVALAAGQGRLRVLTGPQLGVSAARNVGLAQATQPWVQFLDADDLLGEGKIARQMAVGEREEADAVYGDFRELCEVAPGRFEAGRWWRTDLTGDTSCRVFGWSQFIQIGAMLFRREAIARVGGSDPSMRHIEDINLYFRLAVAGARFVHEPGHDVAVWHRKHRTIVSLGASNRASFHAGCLHNIELAHDTWAATAEGLTPARRKALLDDYEFLARFYYEHDRATFRHVMERIHSISPRYLPTAPSTLRRLSRVIGYERAEAVALRYRRLKHWWRAAHGRKVDDGFWHKPSVRDEVMGDQCP